MLLAGGKGIRGAVTLVPSTLALDHDMDTFPREIWIRVFYYACTDGGQTGRSISLVSKRARRLVKFLRLNSLCVTSARQIIGLREYLESFPMPERTVSHLFIASAYPGPDTGIFPTQIYDSMTRILQLVQWTLVTLTTHRLFLGKPILPHGLFFPYLTELTLYDHFNTFIERRAFPSLRRLHLSVLSGGEMLARNIGKACPFLTHLYVLERGLSLTQVEQALGVPQFLPTSTTISVTVTKFLLPRTIQKVLVETDLGYIRRDHTPSSSDDDGYHESLNDKIAQAEF
ncbi:uncharacterized protein BT62DRAFT_996566 [Guyanagaster necrorhizus]|uniref:F-box domain-containing protein n=1 Tax=Guyanagaster necrorhizus TaxID=856835 RepID=A0A9P7VL08_9AGAR|nr:uncharacterized protein BT62DRAFT_996566 [Guyanagaster necrorhizus MCA 3950]KAG7442644.1 hypothetical protein BT62DRAFT_996566 [Guyanagaster necrorhizus MCA 3950]